MKVLRLSSDLQEGTDLVIKVQTFQRRSHTQSHTSLIVKTNLHISTEGVAVCDIAICCLFK